jgi:hypothetical protein
MNISCPICLACYIHSSSHSVEKFDKNQPLVTSFPQSFIMEEDKKHHIFIIKT